MTTTRGNDLLGLPEALLVLGSEHDILTVVQFTFYYTSSNQRL